MPKLASTRARAILLGLGTTSPVTAVELLGLISTALLIQLAVGIGVVLRRRSLAASMPSAQAGEKASRPDLAWQGWREFRVVRRSLEDAARAQCSFYLHPVDGRPLPAFRPGQFLTFSLELAASAAVGAARTITRCYSLSWSAWSTSQVPRRWPARRRAA